MVDPKQPTSSGESFGALIETAVVRARGPREEPYVLDEPGLERVRQAIDQRLDSETLLIAVQTILSFATRLDVERKSPRAAFRLCALVERVEVVSALRKFTGSGVLNPLEFGSRTNETKTHVVPASLKISGLGYPKKM